MSTQFAAKRVIATTLFTDLREFNKIVNILSLEETHAFLNDMYTLIVESVLEHKGTLDKFIGDAVMAVFGSPTQHPDDARNAIVCALAIQSRIDDINVAWQQNLDFRIMIDIGIATGEVLAGNVGHMKRMQYTVIGQSVNLAAQLTEKCKRHNVEILLDGTTYERVKDTIDCKLVEEHLFLGFPEPVKLYTPIIDRRE
jgi:adenylate cyclase